MELDKRIKKGKRPLTCLDIEQARKFVGKECIFSDKYENFKNLDKYLFVDNSDYSAILSIDDYTRNGDYVFRNAKNGAHYGLILPLEWVKEPEKKYRPYTVMEFIKEYPLGSHLHFRLKSDTMEMHRLINGYNDYKNGNGTLFMCGAGFSVSELYDNYEVFKDGEWKTFGVEE